MKNEQKERLLGELVEPFQNLGLQVESILAGEDNTQHILKRFKNEETKILFGINVTQNSPV